MSFHRNAKLGLAGRPPLVRAIEDGGSLKAAAAAFSVSPATAHRWCIAGSRLARRPGGRSPVLGIAQVVRNARPVSSRASSPRRSALADARPAGGRVWSPARPAARTRPCGRCSAGRGSPPAARAARACQQLRVALSRRSAAHGHLDDGCLLEVFCRRMQGIAKSVDLLEVNSVIVRRRWSLADPRRPRRGPPARARRYRTGAGTRARG